MSGIGRRVEAGAVRSTIACVLSSTATWGIMFETPGGLFAEVDPTGGLGVGEPLREQTEPVQLAAGQLGERAGGWGAIWSGEVRECALTRRR
jgi:hypothetical protein